MTTDQLLNETSEMAAPPTVPPSANPGDNDHRGDRPGERRSPVRTIIHLLLPPLIILAVWLSYHAAVGDSAEPSADESATVNATPLADATIGGRSSGLSTAQESTGEGPEFGKFSSAAPEPTDSSAAEGETEEADKDPDHESTEVTLDTEWLLGNGGHSTAQPMLPLEAIPGGAGLPNTDRDRNDDPGLTLQIGSGLGDSDPTKAQRWMSVPGEPAAIDGRPALEIWVAIKDFDRDKSGRLAAGLFQCTLDGADCESVADGEAGFDQAAFGDGFGRVAVNLSPVSVELAPDRALMLKLVVPSSSDDDLWIAYGSSDFPAALTLD